MGWTQSQATQGIMLCISTTPHKICSLSRAKGLYSTTLQVERGGIRPTKRLPETEKETMAGEKEILEEIQDCETDESATIHETEADDTLSVYFCPNCPAIHVEISNGDWCALLTLDAAVSRRIAADLLIAADALDEVAPGQKLN
jgi:hypothetical protein